MTNGRLLGVPSPEVSFPNHSSDDFIVLPPRTKFRYLHDEAKTAGNVSSSSYNCALTDGVVAFAFIR